MLFAVCKKWISNILRRQTPILTPLACERLDSPPHPHKRTDVQHLNVPKMNNVFCFDFLSHLFCCSLRQKSFPLCTCDMEIGTTHSSITADAHTGSGKAGILTKAALLNAPDPRRKAAQATWTPAIRTCWKNFFWNLICCECLSFTIFSISMSAQHERVWWLQFSHCWRKKFGSTMVFHYYCCR